MGIFGLFGGANINDGIEKYKNTPGAVLLDVRTKEEYKSGHIPESRHLSVQNIENVKKAVPDKKTPVFVYCLSGARSSQAVQYMKRSGYENVTNIGGISRYRGKIEK